MSRRGRAHCCSAASTCARSSTRRSACWSASTPTSCSFSEAGVVLRTVYPTFGYTRVWCAKLPDGRVAFSNGLIQGLCTASTTQLWGVPTPVDAGVGIDGGTLYQITYVRDSDRLEGPPLYGNLIDTTQAIIGLPQLAGHSINVYFAPYGDTMFLAGSTSTDTYLHGGGPLGAVRRQRPEPAAGGSPAHGLEQPRADR